MAEPRACADVANAIAPRPTRPSRAIVPIFLEEDVMHQPPNMPSRMPSEPGPKKFRTTEVGRLGVVLDCIAAVSGPACGGGRGRCERRRARFAAGRIVADERRERDRRREYLVRIFIAVGAARSPVAFNQYTDQFFEYRDRTPPNVRCAPLEFRPCRNERRNSRIPSPQRFSPAQPAGTCAISGPPRA